MATAIADSRGAASSGVLLAAKPLTVSSTASNSSRTTLAEPHAASETGRRGGDSQQLA